MNYLIKCCLVMTTLASLSLAARAEPQDPAPDTVTTEPAGWVQVVRNSPYWVSQGVHQNILTIRRWVLGESGYCSSTDRHILFDMRGRFLGYMDNGDTRAETQQRINNLRTTLVTRGEVEQQVPGAPDTTGYPFALACDQPHVDLPEAMARYLGTLPGDRIWGAWDDITFASQDKPRPLHEALDYVYSTRSGQQRIDLPAGMQRLIAGQLMIESGGRQRAHSAANARGIMQLSTTALADCGIEPANYWHRLAQLDCALRLTSQNARNLRADFDARFGHLPAGKREELFTLLLVQAFHGGASRVGELLSEGELARPAAYFAEHHDSYTAGDIAFGMVFHNLGRNRLGLASLYYVADVQLATEALCRSPRLKDTGFCSTPE